MLTRAAIQLSKQTDPHLAVQTAIDTGRQLSGASLGVFVHSELKTSGHGVRLVWSCSSAAYSETFYAVAPLTHLFGALSRPKPELIRVVDVLLDVYAKGPPFRPLSSEQAPLRSVLAIPVIGRGGTFLGAMLFGHPQPAHFQDDLDPLLTMLAAQTASALEYTGLTAALKLQEARSETVQQLQEGTAHRLRHALDAGELGTFDWDRASDRLDLDERAAELLCTTPREASSPSALGDQIIRPEDRDVFDRRLRAAAASAGPYSAECRMIARDGSVSWITLKSLRRTDGGHVTGMTGTVQDITLRKAQEDALLQSEKAATTGRLAASIAHEINNPLEAVTNILYLIKTDSKLPKELVTLVEMADSELARVGHIAQQTLGFYRDTSRPAEMDFSALLVAVAALFERKLDQKQLKCTLEVDPELRLFGYAGEMRQIFSNLFINAIDASVSGTIRLRARRRSLGGHSGVVVLLSDSGSGIPRHLHGRLFSPFFSTKGPSGTGLGLWVTRGMVEKHGGRIHFRSRTEDPAGTIFRVHLPQGSSATSVASSQNSALVH